MSLSKKYNNVITSLLVGKIELALDATVVCLLEAERRMMQESGDTYDRALNVAKGYNNKKKGGKNNSKVKCHYYKGIGRIKYTCPKKRRR